MKNRFMSTLAIASLLTGTNFAQLRAAQAGGDKSGTQSQTTSSDNVQSGTSQEAGQNQGIQSQAAQQGQAPEKHNYKGTVIRSKNVEVRGADTQNRVVLLQAQDGTRYTVDLGPTQNLSGVSLKEGASLEVEGRVGRIADREIVVAETVKANGKSMNIQRQTGTGQQNQERQGS